MSCILCKRTCGIFNIHTIYGNANHSVRDDIIEILGLEAESYLCSTDCVCNVCMNMLENVAKLKWRLWRVLANESQDCKPINLGKIWELFATFKREDDREDDCVSCLTPTTNLLVFSHSRDYNPNLEEQIQIKERNRMSRASSAVISEASEIIEILNQDRKRKRRKSHPRWTHRKRRMTLSASELSNKTFPFSRNSRRLNDTPLSDCSYVSFYTMNRRKKSPVNKEKRASCSEIRTRSVSRVQEEESKCMEQLENMKLYCMEPGCPLYFDDLDVLNHHKIIEHEVPALHYCEECKQKYTTAEHLKLHKKIHAIGPLWCLLCFKEVENQDVLQRHLDEHASYSVPCKYCDRSFLSKSQRESHVKLAHTDKREINLYRKKIILDRIDKDEVSSNVVEKKRPVKSDLQIFMTPFTNVETSANDLDVTAENMRRMNVDFMTGVAPDNATIDVDEESTEIVESETVDVPVTA